MIAEIICVGTELLLGDILNTNAQYLSRKLADLGVSVFYQSVVGDNEKRLIDCVNLAKGRSDLIIFSGGLGPTSDDITKETVAKALNIPLYEDSLQAKRLRDFFNNRKVKMTENNLKQSMIPEGAKILENNNGTAPGVIIEVKEQAFIVLPGPPNELIPMFEQYVVEFIKSKTNENIVSRTLKLIDIGESTAAAMIQDIIDEQSNPSIAPYAKLAEVHFRITAKADNTDTANNLIDDYVKKVSTRLGDYIYTTEDKELEEVIVDNLIKTNKTIATAESCTGGMISSTLVNCPGVSEVFKLGIVSYSNNAKIHELNVSEDSLEKYGAVSEQVAKEMAIGVKEIAKTDFGLSVTGIAGPSGETENKSVGLVYIAIATNDDIKVKSFQFSGNRMKIRSYAAKNALIFLHQILKS